MYIFIYTSKYITINTYIHTNRSRRSTDKSASPQFLGADSYKRPMMMLYAYM
jgi:hypothetical protein